MSTPGRYGQFGGQFLPETLMPAIAELEAAFEAARVDEAFQQELDRLLREWVGRPTPLSDASGVWSATLDLEPLKAFRDSFPFHLDADRYSIVDE